MISLSLFPLKAYGLAGLAYIFTLTTAFALTTQTITFPVIGDQPFANLTQRASITAYGENALILKTDGAAYDPENPSSPVLTGVAAITVGFDHRLFLKADGTVWAQGGNSFGQLGTGDTLGRSTPTQVMNNVAAISAGEGHSLFLKTDGSA